MSVFFTSDLHLGHAFMARHRGFDSIEEHDEAVISSIEPFLTKRTLLWILGDVVWHNSSLKHLARLKGSLKLVLGNHDNFPTGTYLKYFSKLYGAVMYKGLILTHIPIHPQEVYRGRLNVHGHIHANAATENIGLPYYNVNWDFHKKPVSLDELKKVAEELDISIKCML